MRRAEREALALGLLHGPVELVPVSSSGHVAALPWLLRWEVAAWDGERRKELEVALHAGTALALLLVARPRRLRPGLLGPAVLLPAAAGLALERRIEQRLGTPATLAAGLLAGGLALVLADRAAVTRDAVDAGARDGVWLGLAQAAALVPGVSRSGATLAAARLLGFSRADASRLVLGGRAAGAARGARAEGLAPASLARVRPPLRRRGRAFASTLATAGAIGIERRAPLWPWAAWRAGLAAAILAVRQNRAR